MCCIWSGVIQTVLAVVYWIPLSCVVIDQRLLLIQFTSPPYPYPPNNNNVPSEQEDLPPVENVAKPFIFHPTICGFLEEKCPSGNPVIWPIMAKGLRLPLILPQKVLDNWRHLIHLWTLSFSELACCVRSRKLDESLERFSIFCFSAFHISLFRREGQPFPNSKIS